MKYYIAVNTVSLKYFDKKRHLSGGPARWFSGWRYLQTNLMTWVWVLDPIRWKERTGSCKLFSDLHMYITAQYRRTRTHTHTHAHMCTMHTQWMNFLISLKISSSGGTKQALKLMWYPLLCKEGYEVIVTYHLNRILLFILWDTYTLYLLYILSLLPPVLPNHLPPHPPLNLMPPFYSPLNSVLAVCCCVCMSIGPYPGLG